MGTQWSQEFHDVMDYESVYGSISVCPTQDINANSSSAPAARNSRRDKHYADTAKKKLPPDRQNGLATRESSLLSPTRLGPPPRHGCSYNDIINCSNDKTIVIERTNSLRRSLSPSSRGLFPFRSSHDTLQIKSEAKPSHRVASASLCDLSSSPQRAHNYYPAVITVRSPSSNDTQAASNILASSVPKSNGQVHPLLDGPSRTQQPPSGGQHLQRLTDLEEELEELRAEMHHYKDLAEALQSQDKMLRRRLSEQAQKGIQRGTTFEDLNMGSNRPTQIVRRYGDLYSEMRVETLDALDELPEMADYDDLKGKLLFSVIVLAFRAAQHLLRHVKHKLRHYLCLPDSRKQTLDPLSQELDSMIADYLRKTVNQYNLTGSISEVSNQVWSTLYDYPCLKNCGPLRDYIEECVRLAWSASVQNPPLVLEYDSKEFNSDMHTRFYTSDPESREISSVLWPCMLEGEKGPCLQKGVVITGAESDDDSQKELWI